MPALCLSFAKKQAKPALLAQMALRIRKIGTDLISPAGGQFIHPIKTVTGGRRVPARKRIS